MTFLSQRIIPIRYRSEKSSTLFSLRRLLSKRRGYMESSRGRGGGDVDPFYCPGMVLYSLLYFAHEGSKVSHEIYDNNISG